MSKIVNTDNFGGDYPDEVFLAGIQETRAAPLSFSKEQAQKIADVLNGPDAQYNTRYWKVVDDDYQLSRGFRP